MPTPPLTDEQCIEAVAAVRRHHGSHERAAAELNLNLNTFKGRLRKASERGLAGTDPVMPGFRIARVSTTEGADGAVKSRSIVQKPDTDEVSFAIPQGHRIKGVSALVDGNGNVTQTWYKTREDGRDPFAFAQALKEAMAPTAGVLPIAAPEPDADDDLLTVYVLPDLHLGMRAYAKETGENYDLAIADEMARREIGRLVAMSPPARNAVLLFLGDFFHQNDQTNTTPASGHQLDVDGRWRHVYGVGARLAISLSRAIAEKHERVEVAILPGNHDEDAAKTLAVAMDIRFEAEERVSIYDSHSDHWYRRFGQCLLGATHGHRMKPDRMAMMLATDRAEDWGRTRFRHLFFGHIHHETAKSVGPVRVESFTTPAAKDAYAASGGYRSGRALNAVTFHAERGEVCRHRVNIV
jgi:metallophosphoesterase superfamily enzyme